MFDGLVGQIWLVGWVVGVGQGSFARRFFGDIWLVGWVVGVSEKRSNFFWLQQIIHLLSFLITPTKFV